MFLRGSSVVGSVEENAAIALISNIYCQKGLSKALNFHLDIINYCRNCRREEIC